MQRQTSLSSFFQRVPPENRKPGGGEPDGNRVPHLPAKQHNPIIFPGNQLNGFPARESFVEVTGTDTPPEKVPRPVFPTKFGASEGSNGSSSSLFSSIKHKFMKVDDRPKPCDRVQLNGKEGNACSVSSKLINPDPLPVKEACFGFQFKQTTHSSTATELTGNQGCPMFIGDRIQNPCDREQSKGNAVDACPIPHKLTNPEPLHHGKEAWFGSQFKGTTHNSIEAEPTGNKGCPLLVEDDDILGPETPGMRPVVPRFKRVQEECFNFEGGSMFSLLQASEDENKNLGKRMKLHHNSKDENKVPKQISQRNSLFEWLDSSGTKDSNAKKSSIPPHDKKTLQDSKDENKIPGSRMRLLHNSEDKNNISDQMSEKASKFEWLDSSRIRDASGRRPSDPLYDKRTLYIPQDALRNMSASQKQYWSAKSQYMDVVLFFKVGKFYELYEIDADIGHKELDWKITVSGVGKCRQVGISENGIDDAIQKLIARGYKVGRMEQLETAEQAKAARGSTAVIQRKLVHVLTPSTAIDGNIGPDSVHLLAIKEVNCDVANGSTAYGFAFVDCSALKFWIGSISDDNSSAALGALLMQVTPKEVIYENQGLSKEAQKALRKYTQTGSVISQLTPLQPAKELEDASEVRHLIHSKGYFRGSCSSWDRILNGIVHQDLALCALGGLTSHLSRLMLDDVLHNGDVLPYQVFKGCLRMDGQTLANLEIFSNNDDGGPSGTLYSYLNNCITPSGKRLLKNWICHPLKDVQEINNRLNVVEELMSHSEIMLVTAQYLRKLPDLERLLGRVKASFQSSASLVLPLIGIKVLKQRVKAFGSLIKGLRIGMDLLILLQNEKQMMILLSKVLKFPVLSGNDGLDKFLAQFEAAIESDFPNYQDHNVKDSDADMLSILIELFIDRAAEWSQVVQAINCIDVLRSFAVTANSTTGSMTKPIILPLSKPSSSSSQATNGPVLKVKGLWHPYALGENGQLPVSNDILLGEDADAYHPRTLLLTGPNMGGKSTLLRATCLAVLLAQLGSYVPCEMCVLSLVDTIFTRLGSTDRIMTGESTFFIECTETASVLQNATQDSLVLLDELGRGTSTFDGYAIAYAVFRHLVEKVNCRLLFATHYHPLTKEFATHPHVTLQHMACTFNSTSGGNNNSYRNNQELVFLYKLASGACPESYGMKVALMAGVSEQVVEAASRAGRVMKQKIGETFKSSEQRSEFSTLHEDWLKMLVSVSKTGQCDDDDDDTFDTLFCLWHELRSSNKLGN